MSALTSIRLLREIEAITSRRKTHQDKFEALIKFVNDDAQFLKDTGEKFSQTVGDWSPFVIEPTVGAFFNAQIQNQTPALITPSGQAALLPQTIMQQQQPLNLQNGVGANAGKVAKFLSGWQQVIIACVVLVCITIIVSALVIYKLINPILGLEIAVLVIGITIGLIFVAPIVIKFLDRKELQEIETKIEPTMRDMFRDMDDTYITGVFLTKYLAGSKNAEQITVQVKKSIARELQDVLHASIVPIDPSAAPQNQTGMYQVTFTAYSAITAMKDELLTSVPKQAQVIFRGYILDLARQIYFISDRSYSQLLEANKLSAKEVATGLSSKGINSDVAG